MLTDRTPEFDRKPMLKEFEALGAHVRVIYEAATGDYCRETLLSIPVTCSHATAAEYARRYFDSTADANARQHVVAFRIERW